MATEKSPLLAARTRLSNAVLLRSETEVEVASERRGYMLMVVSSLCYKVLELVVRAVTSNGYLTAPNCVFLRGVSLLVFALAYAFAAHDPRRVLSVPRDAIALLVLRGLFGGISVSIAYKAMSILPLGVANSVRFLTPVFTVLLSSVALGESISLLECGAFVLSLSGVAVVAAPEFQQSTQVSQSHLFGIALALLSAATTSVAFVTLRALSSRVHYLCNVLSFATASSLAGAVLSAGELPPFSWWTALLLVGSVFGFVGQCFMTKAFQYCRASTGSLLKTVDVPMAYALGLLFLGELPHATSLLGSALIISGSLVIGVGSMRKSAEKGPRVNNNSIRT